MWIVLRFVLAAMLAGPALAQSAAPAPDCYCRTPGGGRAELGDTLCLFVNGRAFLARCDMSLNVPFWRETGEACLSSALPQSTVELPQPAVQPLGVHAEVAPSVPGA